MKHMIEPALDRGVHKVPRGGAWVEYVLRKGAYRVPVWQKAAASPEVSKVLWLAARCPGLRGGGEAAGGSA